MHKRHFPLFRKKKKKKKKKKIYNLCSNEKIKQGEGTGGKEGGGGERERE